MEIGGPGLKMYGPYQKWGYSSQLYDRLPEMMIIFPLLLWFCGNIIYRVLEVLSNWGILRIPFGKIEEP